MKTDKQIYELFSTWPESLKVLAGIDIHDGYRLDSIVLKGFERRVDCLCTPSEEGDLWFVEFQTYPDQGIYARLVLSMAAYQLNKLAENLRGLIVFSCKTIDPGAKIWRNLLNHGNSTIRVLYLEETLKALAKRAPAHPLVALFAPFQLQNINELSQSAAGHYQNIQEADLPKPVTEKLTAIFTSWMMERFKNLTYEEVVKMFAELTPLEETRAYQELVGKGRKEGLEEGRREGRKALLGLLLKSGKIDRETHDAFLTVTDSDWKPNQS